MNVQALLGKDDLDNKRANLETSAGSRQSMARLSLERPQASNMIGVWLSHSLRVK